ncbi:MAG: hypothetical protein FJ368_02535 [Pelagibacterales bacterium]|nr:hypothetical protein [Pelagibacterales bacterium]
MNKKLNQKYIFVSLLLAFFLICQTVLLVHSFSHKINSSEIGFSDVENSFLEKAFLFHDKNDSSEKHSDDSCSLISLLNLQKQILLCPALLIAIAVFYNCFVKRIFNKVKLSYLLSSYFGRAPPQISL